MPKSPTVCHVSLTAYTRYLGKTSPSAPVFGLPAGFFSLKGNFLTLKSANIVEVACF